MGLIRLLLATSVLIFHAGTLWGYNIADSTLAVLSFFVISGFYMSLILDKKYQGKHNISLFLSNRALRIFPLYFTALALMITLTCIKFFFHVGGADNAIAHYLHYSLSFSPFNFTVQLVNFILRNTTLVITTDYFLPYNKLPGFLLVQQAWTLQIELLFYLLVPFLMLFSKRNILLLVVIYLEVFFGILLPFHLLPGFSLVAIFLQYLLYFLIGVVSYLFLYRYVKQKKINPLLPAAVFLGFLLYLLLYNYIPVKVPLPIMQISDVVYFLILTLALPFIFLVSNLSKIDLFIGSLSYPVYILHFLIIKLMTNIPFFRQTSNLKTIVVFILTLSISFIAVRYIENPIDILRQKRILRTHDRKA